MLLAACKHCENLKSVVLRGGSLHNSTLSACAQLVQDKLIDLDLTGTRTFDDLGIKSFAAYCPSLKSVRLSGTKVSDDGLKAVVKLCAVLLQGFPELPEV